MKKICSLTLAAVTSLLCLNNAYGIVNAYDDIAVGLLMLNNSSGFSIDEKNNAVTFDKLLTMSNDELMKYCEDNDFDYVSQDEIKDELKSGGMFFIRMNPKKYVANGIEDVCVSENVSEIKNYNVSDYDFNKMITELNIPEKYFDIQVDNTPFMVCMESKPTEDDNMKPYFIKLANLSVKVAPEFAKSEVSLRLYQLIKIFPQCNSNFHSISVQYGGKVDYESMENVSADFDTLLNMGEDDLMKYCEQYGLKYISAEDAANNIKSSNILNAMMKVDSYIKDGKMDTTISSDISDIDQHNISDYDFDKMVSDLDLPEKYYDITPDMSLFATFQDSKEIPDSEEREKFFVKLARVPIRVKADLIGSENEVRLYQLAMIWVSKCSEVYNFSIQYLETNDSSDNNEDIFPKTEDEYKTFIKKYGNVSVHGKYIVYCGEINYSTGEKLIVEQSGKAVIKEYTNYTISQGLTGFAGDSAKSVYIYEAVTPGTVKVSFTAGRPWDNDNNDSRKNIGNYEVGEDLTITETNEFTNTVKGDVNGNGEFSISDVVLLQKWLLAAPNTQLTNWKAADFYADGKLDVFDLCLMKQYLTE